MTTATYERSTAQNVSREGNAMDITSIDHLELYVEDGEQVAARLQQAYGFTVQGRGGPETGLTGRRSILLRQRGITLVVTTAVDGHHGAAEYVRRHGDGVAVVGVAVADARAAFTEAVERGAYPMAPPVVHGRRGASATFASVRGFGDVELRFTSRDTPDTPFDPGVVEETAVASPGGLLEAVDHLAVLVPAGDLDKTVRRYVEVFGLTQTFEERIQVGKQAMDSKVVANESGTVTFTLIEPDTTRDPGQIDAFLDAHGGAGVQHIAFRTGDITRSVCDVSAAGVRFLDTPSRYYDALDDRLGAVGVPLATLRELNVLADRDHWGVMLQIFTRSEHPRRTLFYELIDRRGARTFGSNNIKALYEAVDRSAPREDL
ncbi:4-hydroxyphenylpyruvate dioxygenase [Sphaerisporangium rubeum]|uniref:4-hydroxymandelate synthase n=1 Tax=Sphaerisporangium rubeum TaxID=321317 RepID=A0A7X0IJ04_9ACTN|nr:4-hydroxyphenylpyruvate dioxygenase [Sphaerisporangium rubeum]MBB6475840.1 4-hydroxymandelate synthase [Sphaerisporangium rubeum]